MTKTFRIGFIPRSPAMIDPTVYCTFVYVVWVHHPPGLRYYIDRGIPNEIRRIFQGTGLDIYFGDFGVVCEDN